MKQLIAFTTFITLIFLPVVLYTKLIVDFEEFQCQVADERYETKKKIEELEKEIRILKTDIDIMQYGYEEAQNAN